MVRSRAAVAWEAGQPLEIEDVEVAPPKAGEALIRVVASGVCPYRRLHIVRRGS